MIFTVITMDKAGFTNDQTQKIVDRATILRAQGKCNYYGYDEPGPDQTIVWKRQWDTREDAEHWIAFIKTIATPIETAIIEV